MKLSPLGIMENLMSKAKEVLGDNYVSIEFHETLNDKNMFQLPSFHEKKTYLFNSTCDVK